MQDHSLRYQHRSRGLHPSYELLWLPPFPCSKLMQNPRPIMFEYSCTRRDVFAMGSRGTKAWRSVLKSPTGSHSGFQVESLSKLATIFVSFCVLSCRILPLEDRKDQSAFLVGLVSTIPITSRRMRRPDRRPIWMTGSIDSPISAFVSQKVVWACLAHAQIGERGGCSRKVN